MCSCGCRGWCTLYPLLEAWAVDLKNLEQTCPIRYAVIDIQGDWPAFLQVFGLRYWAHKTHPCPLCTVNQAQMQEVDVNNITLDSLMAPDYTTENYAQDVADSVHKVLIRDVADRSAVFQQLEYKETLKGRADCSYSRTRVAQTCSASSITVSA